jgi:rhodanese-related sulfurtransferase
VEQISEFVLNNLILFAALVVVLVMLIKAELDHQANKGLMLSATAAIRLINNNDDILIIDTRSVAEYKAGHISNSKNVPQKDLLSELEKYSDHKNKPVLVYCNSGSSATRAIRMLKNAGFVKVNNLEGGIAAWKEANMPITKK